MALCRTAFEPTWTPVPDYRRAHGRTRGHGPRSSSLPSRRRRPRAILRSATYWLEEAADVRGDREQRHHDEEGRAERGMPTTGVAAARFATITTRSARRIGRRRP